jgi:gamma-glutamyltranspeptidase/glutathione hydrolase
MSPLIATRNGRPVLVAGGSGGPTIITGVGQVGLATLDFQMEAEAAVSAPRIHEQNEPAIVFADEPFPPSTIRALEQMGYAMKLVPELGAISTINFEPGALDGGSDPRKGGAAVGY